MLLIVAFALAGCATVPPPRADYSFALLGDVPYSHAQANQLDELIRQINAEPLSFVVHVGDITSGKGPCDDGWLESRRIQFGRLRHPFVLLPGDNEWTDCHRSGFDPLERLARWRGLFCSVSPELGVERQSNLDARFPEYCEHVRWRSGDVFYIALNVPGSNNNLGRTKDMDLEHARRMDAVFEWLDESLARAEFLGAAGVVVLMHANPDFEGGRRRRPDGYERLRNVLGTHAGWQRVPLLLVHGDTHTFRDDRPLPGLHRIEVYGSPQVRWLRATVSGGRVTVSD